MDFGTALIPKESPPSAHSSRFLLINKGCVGVKASLLYGGEKIIRKRAALSAFRRRKAGILEERSGSLLVLGLWKRVSDGWIALT